MRTVEPERRRPSIGETRMRSALILDDEVDRRLAMQEGLREHGVASQLAATLEEAIRRLASFSYDLVVCDLILSDPPEAANPALRGYLAACYALAHSRAVVVQASSMRRWAHPGAVLTNFRVEEVANLVYGSTGIPTWQSDDGGCPWGLLQRAAGAAPDQRRAVAGELAGLPIVLELQSSLQLGPRLDALEDAAEGQGDWGGAVAAVGGVLFPGAGGAC
jgi:CheY-like chemotaxis protein